MAKVFVNINDAVALAPAGESLIFFVDHLLERWPRIEHCLLRDLGGASYFPNAIHCFGKNDLEMLKAREQMFCFMHFCRIAHALHPRVCGTLRGGFLSLLRPSQR